MNARILRLVSLIAMLSWVTLASAQTGVVDATGDADGNGGKPYKGSTMNYSVTDTESTAKSWVVSDTYNGAATDVANAEITAGDGTNGISVNWKKKGEYYIIYTGTLNDCSTKRVIKVEVIDNPFQIDASSGLTGGATSICSSESGNVLDWGTYETKNDVTTDLVFTVTKTDGGSSAINVTDWKFHAALSGLGSLTVSNVSLSTGSTKNMSTAKDDFDVEGLLLNGTVTITVTVAGNVTASENVVLTISNGVAITAKGEIAADNNGATLTQTLTLKPLPGTSNITH